MSSSGSATAFSGSCPCGRPCSLVPPPTRTLLPCTDSVRAVPSPSSAGTGLGGSRSWASGTSDTVCPLSAGEQRRHWRGGAHSSPSGEGTAAAPASRRRRSLAAAPPQSHTPDLGSGGRAAVERRDGSSPPEPCVLRNSLAEPTSHCGRGRLAIPNTVPAAHSCLLTAILSKCLSTPTLFLRISTDCPTVGDFVSF